MIDMNKVKERIKANYSHVKVFHVGVDEDIVFMACNFNDNEFLVVTFYLDSEVGGHFKINKQPDMVSVYDNFDIVQAEHLRTGIIQSVRDGTASVIGKVNPKELH